MSFLSRLKSAFTEAAGIRAKLEQDIEVLKQHREHLLESPVSLEDYTAHINKFIDVRRERYEEVVARSVANRQRSPLKDWSDCPKGQAPFAIVSDIVGNPSNVPTQDLIVGLLGDLIKQEYEKVLKRIKWADDPGPAPHLRDKEVEKTTAKIDKLESELTELLASVDQVGGRSERL